MMQRTFFGDEDREQPARARRTDPETSHDAAESVSRIRASQQYILSLFDKFGSMADFELERTVKEHPSVTIKKLSPSGIRTRRSELVTKRLLRDSGRRAMTVSGRQTIVWEMVR